MKRRTIAFDLKKWRKDNGFSQAECARQLETTDKTIRQWEIKQSVPVIIERYCILLDNYKALRQTAVILLEQRR